LLQGRWEIILFGNTGDLHPYKADSYIEYYNDSLFREYNYEMEEYETYGKYIIDNLFTKSYFYTEDTITFIYEFYFFENNSKLRLESYSLVANFNTYIFERIEY
jgi:hypothetical protein